MIKKYGKSGGDLYHDNCFYVQLMKNRELKEDYEW